MATTISSAGLSRFRRWYSQYRATHGMNPPRNMVSSFLEAEIEAQTARLDKARMFALEQQRIDVSREQGQRSLELRERELAYGREMGEKELGLKREQIEKQDRAAKWSGVGTAVLAAPTAYKLGQAAYDWVLGKMSVRPEMIGEVGAQGTAGVGGTAPPAIGTMSAGPELIGEAGYYGVGGTFGGGVEGAMPAGATATGATYGGLTGAEMAGASGYAPAGMTTGGSALSYWSGPVAAIAAPLLGYLGGHRSREKTQHGYEDWLGTLTPEQRHAYFVHQNKNWRWNTALNQFGVGPMAESTRYGMENYAAPKFQVPAGAERPPDWLTPTMVYSGPTDITSQEELSNVLFNKANWREDPGSFYTGTSRGMGIYR